MQPYSKQAFKLNHLHHCCKFAGIIRWLVVLFIADRTIIYPLTTLAAGCGLLVTKCEANFHNSLSVSSWMRDHTQLSG